MDDLLIHNVWMVTVNQTYEIIAHIRIKRPDATSPAGRESIDARKGS